MFLKICRTLSVVDELDREGFHRDSNSIFKELYKFCQENPRTLNREGLSNIADELILKLKRHLGSSETLDYERTHPDFDLRHLMHDIREMAGRGRLDDLIDLGVKANQFLDEVGLGSEVSEEDESDDFDPQELFSDDLGGRDEHGLEGLEAGF